ncbi:relaxase, partial [Alistipes onderdonkii]
YPAPKEVRQVAERQAEQKHEEQNHAANPISGIVDTVLDLADTRAYEEQQRLIQRRKKRRSHK